MRAALPIILNSEQRQALEEQARARSLAARQVERAASFYAPPIDGRTRTALPS